MQIDVVTNNQAQQETSKEYVRKVHLPPYVWDALNVCRISNLSLSSAACSALLSRYMMILSCYFPCSGCTDQWKNQLLTALWIHVKVPCKPRRAYGLFVHWSQRLWCQTQVLNVHVVCLQVLEGISADHDCAFTVSVNTHTLASERDMARMQICVFFED